jgi:hypothetical protein
LQQGAQSDEGEEAMMFRGGMFVGMGLSHAVYQLDARNYGYACAAVELAVFGYFYARRGEQAGTT